MTARSAVLLYDYPSVRARRHRRRGQRAAHDKDMMMVLLCAVVCAVCGGRQRSSWWWWLEGVGQLKRHPHNNGPRVVLALDPIFYVVCS